MTQILRRPADAGDGDDCLRMLREALDAEGVPPGGDYWASAIHEPDLNGGGQHRRNDPQTARDAAKMLQGSEIRRDVLRAFGELGEATGTEVAEHTGRKRDSVFPRFSELRRCDPPQLRKTGRKRRNPDTGVLNETWELTEHGQARLGLI